MHTNSLTGGHLDNELLLNKYKSAQLPYPLHSNCLSMYVFQPNASLIPNTLSLKEFL